MSEIEIYTFHIKKCSIFQIEFFKNHMINLIPGDGETLEGATKTYKNYFKNLPQEYSESSKAWIKTTRELTEKEKIEFL